MILAKTERGRALLAERRALSPRERQLLVLADGRRSTAELERWLGFAVEPVMQRLVTEGYLERVRLGPGALPIAELPPAAPLAVPQPVAEPASPVVPLRDLAPAGAARGGSRRSLAASKMYVVSLMQMLRDADAASLAVSLHCAEAAEDLVDALVAALVFVHRRSGADYAARVASRLMEVMPMAHLPQLCDALEATGAAVFQEVSAVQRETSGRTPAPMGVHGEQAVATGKPPRQTAVA
ncbi:hypothetical protein FVQ98_15025 [Ottowia sp. GY511]|uniref:MarR family transcriptional regulator n=1 Tax=Ottowia flava TaxID=2675430 RepID=A0ABW4KWQ4_9BURK|nr:hypothetical protein [Ottowia sp. GY511]TXK26279.1 hypothetical protein FVQ98_15025 [Ottowia sp. GY511]